jgi:hypothetical protein
LKSLLTVEQINSLITLIGTIITAGIGVGGARWIVSKWQARKDISEIRKEVLRNYTISFKNHVNLMDNFVAYFLSNRLLKSIAIRPNLTDPPTIIIV